MSIQSEVARLESAKSAIAGAITAKGVTVPDTTKLDGYADLVAAIQAGSGAYDITSTDNGDGTQSLAIVDAEGGGGGQTYTVMQMGMDIYTGSAGDIVNLSIREKITSVKTATTMTSIPYYHDGSTLMFVLPAEDVVVD